MTDDRLSASVEAAGLIRRAQSEGGFAAILHKGDADRGALLLVVRGRGEYVACLERALDPAGRYAWATTGPNRDEHPEKLGEYLERRVRFDGDNWIIELDIAHPERFIAETTSAG